MNNRRPTINRKRLIDYLKHLKAENQITFLDLVYSYTLIVYNINLDFILEHTIYAQNDSFLNHFSNKSLNYIYWLCECLDQPYPCYNSSKEYPNYLESQKKVMSFFKEKDFKGYHFLNQYFFHASNNFQIIKKNIFLPNSFQFGSNLAPINDEFYVTIMDGNPMEIEYTMAHEFQHALDFIRLQTDDPFRFMIEANPIFREFQYLDNNSQELDLYYDRLDFIRALASDILDALDGDYLSLSNFVDYFTYIQSYLQAVTMRNQEKSGISKLQLMDIMTANLKTFNGWSHYFNYPIIGVIPAIPIDNHFRFLEELEKDKRFIK